MTLDSRMDNLPDHVIIEILSRLNDSTELARCKCVSKNLNTLARQVRSIHLYCSVDRYTKMRSPEARWKVTPFKSIIHKLISSDAKAAPIESVSLGIDESFYSFDDYEYFVENMRDDLFLTAGPFCDDWMTKIGHGLKSISISAFWPQSDNKETNILEVISYHCHSLVELTLENASVSVDDMDEMSLLTSLMLKNVTILDKHHLSKLIECLPGLQVLNIFDDNGIIEPKIHHLNLKEFKYTQIKSVRHYLLTSMTIIAPNLAKLELQCVEAVPLVIHAPSLSYFHLAVESEDQCIEFDADSYNVDGFKSLKTLRLVSPELHFIFIIFPSSRTVENLMLDSPKWWSCFERFKFSLVDMFNLFPNVTSLTMGSEVWSQQIVYPLAPSPQMKSLKQITLYLVLGDIDKALSFILYIVGICTHLSDIVLFIHRDVNLSAAISFVSRCTSQCPKVRLRWGIWKEGTKDCCISNCIGSAANAV